jgi:hypothetical protein
MGEAVAAVRDYRRREAAVGSAPRDPPLDAQSSAASRALLSGDDGVRAGG